jgi:UDP-N-acetylmuramoyl-tripeptide--D-alanyl-D-alanine ligase
MTDKDKGRLGSGRVLRSATKKLGLSEIAKRLKRHVDFQLLDWRARGRRAALKDATVIGVTGSCGKSTTTALIGAILAKIGACQTYINQGGGGRNTDIRVRRAMLSLNPANRYYVYEACTTGPGTIARQLEIVRPQIGVVTNVGTDHRKAFRTLEATAREKATLVDVLPPDGMAILNADDPHVAAMTARTKARVVTYGLSSSAEIRGSNVDSRWPDRLTLDVSHGNHSIRVATRLVGDHWATSVLAAISCGIGCGLDLAACAEAVSAVEPVFGRYSVHRKEGGPVFILDSAKASYWTIPSALAFLATASASSKTVVFGTISDYAGNASRVYRRLARHALAVADRIVFVGPHSDHIARLRKQDVGNRLFSFQSAHTASAFLSGTHAAEEMIFIKASVNADHLERIMLAQCDTVVCWRERCKRSGNCPACAEYRRSSPPPFTSTRG